MWKTAMSIFLGLVLFLVVVMVLAFVIVVAKSSHDEQVSSKFDRITEQVNH